MNINNKVAVITTINPYDKTCIDQLLKFNYKIVVVGDLKTPHHTYKTKNTKELTYVHPIDNDLINEFNEFAQLLPFNHYCRKNIGYLYAIQNEAELIFDTDDDNYPLDNFESWQSLKFKTISGPKFPNVLKLYTEKHIWPRGYPLEFVNKYNDPTIESDENKDLNDVGVIQSLANGDPDVDAICRLTSKDYGNSVQFEKNKGFIFKQNVYTQGNTQSTIWKDKKLFHLLYIPVTVSFRFCDILKMYIAQRLMWEYDKLFCYVSPIVNQERNDHDYLDDFKSEYPMYVSILDIVDNIFNKVKLNGNIYDLLLIYQQLYKNGIVKDVEIKLVKKWLNILEKLNIV